MGAGWVVFLCLLAAAAVSVVLLKPVRRRLLPLRRVGSPRSVPAVRLIPAVFRPMATPLIQSRTNAESDEHSPRGSPGASRMDEQSGVELGGSLGGDGLGAATSPLPVAGDHLRSSSC